MNNGYNFNFNTNPSFVRGFPNVIPTPNISHIPRISSFFRGAGGLGSAANAAQSKITFSGILNGASKTLGVINQAIPVFYQVKPIWNNARTMFKVVKGLNSSDNSTSNTKKENIQTKQKELNKSSNAPVFFD